jgi:hypothetical protein
MESTTNHDRVTWNDVRIYWWHRLLNTSGAVKLAFIFGLPLLVMAIWIPTPASNESKTPKLSVIQATDLTNHKAHKRSSRTICDVLMRAKKDTSINVHWSYGTFCKKR